MSSTTINRRGWLALLPVLAIGALAPATALGASDLSITKTDSADPATENVELTYTITVANGGPDAANGVQVVDDLPSQVDLVAATASQGTCEAKGPKVTCDLGTLESGATATVTLRVLPKKAGQLSNTATVSTVDTDPNAQNNSDTETTMVVAADGGGNPGATCGGRNATIVGTDGSETLIGTAKNDVIVALGGEDTVRGRGGKDIICTAGGNDSVFGGAGNDQLRGGGGDDTLRGGGGDDALRGGGGNDAIRGGGGNDDLAGGAGKDSLSGGRGDDRCRGGGGQDSERSC